MWQTEMLAALVCLTGLSSLTYLCERPTLHVTNSRPIHAQSDKDWTSCHKLTRNPNRKHNQQGAKLINLFLGQNKATKYAYNTISTLVP